MSAFREAREFYKQKKKEEKLKKKLLSKKSDWHLLEQLIQKCNENPDLRIEVRLNDGTVLLLKTYYKKEISSTGNTDVNVTVNLPENSIPVDAVTDGDMHAVTSNAVANLLDIYIIDINYTIPANSSYIATYNADTSEYKTILAVIESTGDNKVIPFRCEYNNGSVSIGLQNLNAVDLTLELKIRLLRKHI